MLQSVSDRGLYVGFTADLRRRVRQHQAGVSLATANRGPWELVDYEAYRLRQDAEGRERFLKSGAGRRYLAKQCAHWFTLHPVRRQAVLTGDEVSSA